MNNGCSIKEIRFTLLMSTRRCAFSEYHSSCLYREIRHYSDEIVLLNCGSAQNSSAAEVNNIDQNLVSVRCLMTRTSDNLNEMPVSIL